MTFLEFHADLARTANALEKIAELLEKLVCPPVAADVKINQATLDDLKYVDEDTIIRMQQEQSEFAQRFQVVPNSPAFEREFAAWVIEMRSIHGEQWEPPEDWQAVLAAQGYRQSDGEAAAAASRER